MLLSIGLPTLDDFDGVYFTVQALRLFHDLTDCEILVIDSRPESNHGQETKHFCGWAGIRYIEHRGPQGTAAAKARVFREAQGDAVLCLDSHVLLTAGAIERLKIFYRAHPETENLHLGPLLYDDLKTISTEYRPEWRGLSWGTWHTDERGADPSAAPFPIWGGGSAAMTCRKAAFLGFPGWPWLSGWGGDEAAFFEAYRQAGREVLCLPFLRWVHRFGRPGGAPYRVTATDKARNTILGLQALGLPLDAAREHFLAEGFPADHWAAIEHDCRALQGL